jgi:hypothetical protein
LPRAEVAAESARGKALVERPVIRGISTDPKLPDTRAEDAAWAKIAALHLEDARLDQSSRALMRAKNTGRYANPGALNRAVGAFERVIAEDTVRNEYVMRRQIHSWFAGSIVTGDVDRLNEKVYAELFLTPSSDKWLGLFPEEGYTGIENDGVSKQ